MLQKRPRVQQMKLLVAYAVLIMIGKNTAVARADSVLPKSEPATEMQPVALSRIPQYLPAERLNQTLIGEKLSPEIPSEITKALICGEFNLRFKMIVDSDGSVSRIDPLHGPGSEDPKVLAELQRWRFHPRSGPVWTIQQFHYRVILNNGESCEAMRNNMRFLSPRLAGALMLHKGQRSGWPASVPPLKENEMRTVVYRLCVRDNGTVMFVIPIRGFNNIGDKDMIESILNIQYQSLNFQFCTFYFQTYGTDLHNAAEPLNSAKVVPAVLVKKELIEQIDPRLPDVVKAAHKFSVVTGTYKLCIGLDGSIDDLEIISGIPGADEDIMQTLLHWKYRPRIDRMCFVQFLEFHIN